MPPFSRDAQEDPMRPPGVEHGPSLGTEAIELLAARVAELLAGHLTIQTSQSPAPASGPTRLLSAAEVSEWWGVGRGWVYQHADELGAIRLGDGERPRLRFDAGQVAQCLDRPPANGPQSMPEPATRVRRSPRIRGDAHPLAFRTDPELSSVPHKTRWPGGAPTPPAAAPKNKASAR